MSFSLGLDIGTTKVAAVIIDSETGKLADAVSFAHGADLAPADPLRSEQDAAALLDKTLGAVRRLNPESRRKISSVGVTGQMHGVVLQSRDGSLSPLCTWKDKRCSKDGFLAKITALPGCAKLKDGYGASTIAWLLASGGQGKWESSATIYDLLVSRLCGLGRPVTDPTSAASWGIYDLKKQRWSPEAVKALAIPESLLPVIAPCGSKAGSLTAAAAAELGLPAGIPVCAAVGDNQASILAMSKSAEKDIYLTVGTGAQLSVVIPASAAGQKLPESVDPRPFPGGGFLAVAAPLCGGQAFAWLVKSVKAMSAELGLGELKEDDLYPKIDALAMACPPGSGLKISPNFLGERHAPDIRGAVSGLTLGNLSIGAAARALAEGIMMNMRSMTPAEFFAGRETVVGSGNALRRLAVMRRAAEDVFGLPLVMPDTREEAASGAALLAAKLV